MILIGAIFSASLSDRALRLRARRPVEHQRGQRGVVQDWHCRGPHGTGGLAKRRIKSGDGAARCRWPWPVCRRGEAGSPLVDGSILRRAQRAAAPSRATAAMRSRAPLASSCPSRTTLSSLAGKSDEFSLEIRRRTLVRERRSIVLANLRLHAREAAAVLGVSRPVVPRVLRILAKRALDRLFVRLGHALRGHHFRL